MFRQGQGITRKKQARGMMMQMTVYATDQNEFMGTAIHLQATRTVAAV